MMDRALGEAYFSPSWMPAYMFLYRAYRAKKFADACGYRELRLGSCCSARDFPEVMLGCVLQQACARFGVLAGLESIPLSEKENNLTRLGGPAMRLSTFFSEQHRARMAKSREASFVPWVMTRHGTS